MGSGEALDKPKGCEVVIPRGACRNELPQRILSGHGIGKLADALKHCLLGCALVIQKAPMGARSKIVRESGWRMSHDLALHEEEAGAAISLQLFDDGIWVCEPSMRTVLKLRFAHLFGL